MAGCALGVLVISTPSAPMPTPLQSLAQQTWSTFCETPQTLGPTDGVRQQWHRGRPLYTVWVLRVRSPEVLNRWQQACETLGYFMVPQPQHDLHITVWVAGFPCAIPQHDDDVSEQTLSAHATRLRSLPGPIHLTIGGANAFLSCAFLEVQDPHQHLARCRAHLESVGTPEIRFAPYLPHVTLGSFDRTQSTTPIVAALRKLRDLPPIHIVADAIERIDYDTHLDTPPLHTRQRIPLERV